MTKDEAREMAERYRRKHNIPPDPFIPLMFLAMMAYPLIIFACMLWEMMPASLFLIPLFFLSRD